MVLAFFAVERRTALWREIRGVLEKRGVVICFEEVREREGETVRENEGGNLKEIVRKEKEGGRRREGG